MSSTYVPPVLENTTDKNDALDWNTLPNERCDLNYRPLKARPPWIQLRTVGLLLLVPFIALPTVLVLQLYSGTTFATSTGFILSILIGAVAAIACLQVRLSLKQVGLAFVGPSLLWLLMVAMPFHRFPAASVLIFLAFGLPTVFWFADAVATHAVHWMSAHYKNDHATMLAWRKDWESRFVGIADRSPRRPDLRETDKALHGGVLATRSAYRYGFLSVLGLVLLSSISVLGILPDAPRFTTGFGIVLGVFVALFVVCVIRTIQFPGSLQRTWFYFTDWIWHGSFLRQPPWVFQSPSGNLFQRQGATLLVLFIVTLTLIPLGDYFRWLYFGAYNAEVLPEHLVENPNPLSLWWAVARGNLYVGVLTITHYLLLFGTPGLFVFMATHFLAGPVISAHHLALEGPHAYEQHHGWDRLDGYCDRLLKSRNPKEQNSMIVARTLYNDYPILVHLKLAFEHFHVLGGTGIGKTTLGLMTDMIQLIRRKDGPVVVVDCKGDMALFHTARIEAERAGRKFKWFTNRQGHSTYVFNPFDKNMYSQLSLHEIVGLLMSALNLHHGPDYGRAWFTIANRVLMKRAFQETLNRTNGTGGASRRSRFDRIESFKDLNDIILFLAADGKEYQAAQHLAFLIESLAEFEQLNMSGRTHPNHASVENAINMSDAIANNEVIYFFLAGAVDSQSVAEIGRLAIYSLLNACINHKDRTGQRANAYLLVDEAQAVIAQNIAQVLAQARSFGMACFLAHQTMSQLNQAGGTDLRELFMGCTGIKQVFSARDPWLQKYVTDMSGRVRYTNLSYQQNANDLLGGLFGIRHAVKNEFGVPAVEAKEVVGPGLTPQDILDVNRDNNMCMLMIERAEAFSRWIRFAPAYVDWPMQEHEYDDRQHHTPWPIDTPETITTRSPWPVNTRETIVPTKAPVETLEEYRKLTDQRLGNLKRDLDDD